MFVPIEPISFAVFLSDSVKISTVSAFIPPSTSFIVSLSNPTLPEQKTNPLALMACENMGNGPGASEVHTSVIDAILCL